MENFHNIQKLFSKYTDNSISKEELTVLLRYFGREKDDAQLRQLVLDELSNADVEIDNEQLGRSVDAVGYRLREKLKPHKSLKLRKYLPYAAAILLLGVSSITYYFFNKNALNNEPQISITDIKPGRNAATLTLADGKKILLNDATAGTIAAEQGITIHKNQSGELVYTINDSNGSSGNTINTLSTANGETYQIVLSDGTKVWLNAASSLQYSTNLKAQGKRNVKLLAGEGYFEVAKDKAHPFIVETPTQKVEVLGTRFNINSYADEGLTTTTLAEGSVKVSALGSAVGDTEILKPGQQSLNSNGIIKVRQADLETALAWKDGEIYFRDATIQQVMGQVSRWYNVEIKYEGTPTKEVFNGGIKRTASLSSVLRILELSSIHFELLKKNNTTILKVTQTK